MDNKINFTGIKNIASAEFARQGFHPTKNISLVLTDDFHGKDLQEFKTVLSKVKGDSSVYKNEEYPSVINLECLREGGNQGWLSLNGTILEENDANLPVFSYLAKLTRRIMNMPDKEMVVNNDYKNYAANDILIHGTDFGDSYEQLIKYGVVDKMFDRDNVRDGAKSLNNSIQKIMNKYFGIKE